MPDSPSSTDGAGRLEEARPDLTDEEIELAASALEFASTYALQPDLAADELARKLRASLAAVAVEEPACARCGYLRKSHRIPEASGECPAFVAVEDEGKGLGYGPSVRGTASQGADVEELQQALRDESHNRASAARAAQHYGEVVAWIADAERVENADPLEWATEAHERARRALPQGPESAAPLAAEPPHDPDDEQ